MHIQKPIPPRHTVDLTGSTLTITVPVKKRWFPIFWISLWLLMWTFMAFITLVFLVSILYAQLSPDGRASNIWVIGLFFIPFIAVLVGMGYFGWGRFFWNIAGRETIEITSQYLTITGHLWNWKRSHSFHLDQVKNFLVAPEVGWTPFSFFSARSSLFFSPRISFDYGAKAFYFGRELDDAEARQIIAEVEEQLSLRRSRLEQIAI